MSPAARRFVVPAQVRPAPPSTPTFSIVIAAFQAAATIRDALASAFAQTYRAVDIVVCDDGSTDGLIEQIDEYLPQVELLQQENRGEAAAKNAAVGAARGEFVAILDADDIYLPERLEALAALSTTRPDLDILTTDAYLEIDGRVERRCYDRGWTFDVESQRTAILQRNFIFGLAAVRRSRLAAIGGFDESLRYAMDWDCWIRLLATGSAAGLVDEPLARYRLRRKSLSAQRSQLLRGRVEVLERASVSTALTPAERRIARRSARTERAAAIVAEAQDALRSRSPDARARMLRVTVSRDVTLLTRLKALAAATAPSLAADAAARRWYVRPGPADLPFGPSPADDTPTAGAGASSEPD